MIGRLIAAALILTLSGCDDHKKQGADKKQEQEDPTQSAARKAARDAEQLTMSDPDRATFRQFTIGGTANYGKYTNDQVDKLLKDARTTLDQSKAKTLYADAVKQIVDDAPYIFVQYQEYIAMYTPKLQGYVVNPVANWLSFKTVSLAAS